MKGLLVLVMFVAISCKKEFRDDKSLLGVWVEKLNRKDTLVVYKEGQRFMMFDNSQVYRDFRGTWMTNDAFRLEFRLKDGKIGFKLDDTSREFYYYDFRWIRKNEEFTMRYNGLRPYLSSIGDITYERVK